MAKKLMNCFPNSFINSKGEFIAHREANEYFNLDNCNDELEVKCKVLAWFSRGAHKTAPFGKRKNEIFHKFMLDGINSFLGTDFTSEDMDLIYTYLGNDVNRDLTIKFINSGYDMAVIDKTAERQDVRRGKWLLEIDPNGNPYCFHCSVCDDDFHYTGIKTVYDFCPNCGAKMDKEWIK